MIKGINTTAFYKYPKITPILKIRAVQ